MRKILALLAIIALLVLFTWYHEERFLDPLNISNLLRNSALLSIYAIGVGFVIIAGGIDLSIGSVIAFTGYLTALLLSDHGWSPLALLPTIILVGFLIGLVHGSLVAFARVQPFVVTLCGLLVYRGLARIVSGDRAGSISEDQAFIKALTSGPAILGILIVVAVLAQIFLSSTVWGRYIYAVGNNEEASRFSGINTGLTKIMAFVICSVLAAFSGILEVSNVGAITPTSTGAYYELYAIAAAVLGGCSLRGGEGNVLGIILGAIAIRLTRNAMNILGILSQWEFFVLGLVILLSALFDSGLGGRWIQFLKKKLARQA